MKVEANEVSKQIISFNITDQNSQLNFRTANDESYLLGNFDSKLLDASHLLRKENVT